MARLAGLEFEEHIISPDDPSMKAEILLLSSSMRWCPAWVTRASRCGTRWPLASTCTKSSLLGRPAACRHQGPCALPCRLWRDAFGLLPARGSLPMNIKARFQNFKVRSRAQGDIDRVLEIWDECLSTYGGPFLFGDHPTLADAMYALVVTRFVTYGIPPRTQPAPPTATTSCPARHERVGGRRPDRAQKKSTN